jgi:hypothetical protein
MDQEVAILITGNSPHPAANRIRKTRGRFPTP